MKKTVSIIIAVTLAVSIILSCLTAGMTVFAKTIAAQIEYNHIEKFYADTMSMNGDVNTRIIVTSSKKIDDTNAAQIASGYGDYYIFQYETKAQADEAYRYFSSLESVEEVEFDELIPLCDYQIPQGNNLEESFTLCTDEFVGDVHDAKCVATASNYIDDMIELISENYTDLEEVKIGVIDTGCEDNALTHDVVQNIGNNIGADCAHGTKVCGTLIYNTLDNVTIYSYDCGDSTGLRNTLCIASMAMADADGCDIINMSYGNYKTSTKLEAQIDKCYEDGVIMIAAAGNDGKRITATANKFYPACNSKVAGIGAVDEARKKSDYTNYGTGISYYTVGSSVRTFEGNSDVYWTGTSAASPVMAAIVANMLSVRPGMTFAQIRSALKVNPTHEDTTTYNSVDGYETLSALIGKTLPWAQFSYEVHSNPDSDYCEVTFHCDENVRIYCNLDSVSVIASNNSQVADYCLYDGDTLTVDRETTVNVVANATGMHKSRSHLIQLPATIYDSGYTFDAAKGEASFCQEVDAKRIVVPSEIDGVAVTSIGVGTFAGIETVEEIVIPESVKTIGGYAFANCENLKRVILLGATTIGRFAFENCDNLLYIHAPNVKRTYTRAVFDCDSLLGIYMPSLTNKAVTTFDLSPDVISLDTTGHYYCIDGSSSNEYLTYMCGNCYNEDVMLDIPPSVIQEMWTPYLIGLEPQSDNEYDSLFLFDTTGDGIINAKDYSIIANMADKYKDLYEEGDEEEEDYIIPQLSLK